MPLLFVSIDVGDNVSWNGESAFTSFWIELDPSEVLFIVVIKVYLFKYKNICISIKFVIYFLNIYCLASVWKIILNLLEDFFPPIWLWWYKQDFV